MFDNNKYLEINDFLKKHSKSTKIVAISKNHPKDSVIDAIKFGVEIFGENRVNEAKNNFEDIKTANPLVKLHLTGPLQSNKVKEAAKLFDVFHTLDREKIAIEFNKNLLYLKNKKIFIQVNTGREETKSGIFPVDVSEFINYCINDMQLNIVGLMCIPPVNDNPDDHFSLLSDLAKRNNLHNLSIGMSSDYKKAIKFKPKYIRLGTILFGKRND